MSNATNVPPGPAQAENDLTAAPYLVLVLDGNYPSAPVFRYALDEFREVRIERGERREVLRGAIGGSARDGRCLTLRFPDHWMSRNHASIRFDDNSVVMTDPGSKNRSFVNGIERRSSTLMDGDLLQFGHTFFMYRAPRSARPEPSPDLDIDPKAASSLDTLLPSLAARIADATAAAAAGRPILLVGERGTGKQRVARALHAAHRADGRFAVMPGDASDGADAPDLLASARAGTLHVTNFGALSGAGQAALGDAMDQHPDVLVIAADHGDVQVPSRRSSESPDPSPDPLISRFAQLALPPLHQRREDHGLLLGMYLHRVAPDRELGLSVDAAYALLSYAWPGNLPEFDHAIDEALARCDDSMVTASHLPRHIQVATSDIMETADTVELTEKDLAKRAKLVAMLQARHGDVSAVAKVLQENRDVIEGWLKRLNINADRFRD